MAHGNYECCACCDEHIAFSADASAKAMLCARCACELARRGVFVHDADEFLAWVKTEEVGRLCQVLIEVDYLQCYYGNDVDDTVTARLANPHFGTRFPERITRGEVQSD